MTEAQLVTEAIKFLRQQQAPIVPENVRQALRAFDTGGNPELLRLRERAVGRFNSGQFSELVDRWVRLDRIERQPWHPR